MSTLKTKLKALQVRAIQTGDKNFCDGIPDENKNFEIKEIPEILQTELKEDEILVETLYMDIAPALRLTIERYNKTTKVPRGLQIAKVIKSNSKDFKVNDIIRRNLQWQTHNIFNVKSTEHVLTLIRRSNEEKEEENNIPLSSYLNEYGLIGRTAHYGLCEIAKIKPNSVILISGASGATGNLVGQIAKNIYNCFVIGSAGSNEKLNWMKNELKFDFVFNYKLYKTKEEIINVIKKGLKEGNKNDINYYFDNTGGLITDSIWSLLGFRATVIICGQLSMYNNMNDPNNKMPRFLMSLIYREIKILGMSVLRISKEADERFLNDMKKWVNDGKIKAKETVINGFENAPKAFVGLLKGQNIGKMLVKVQ